MLVYKLIIYVISAGVYNLLEPSAYEEILQRLLCNTYCRAAMPRTVKQSGNAARTEYSGNAAQCRTKRQCRTQSGNAARRTHEAPLQNRNARNTVERQC